MYEGTPMEHLTDAIVVCMENKCYDGDLRKLLRQIRKEC